MWKAMIVPAIALVAAGSASGVGAGFSPHVTNPWFPLAPGTTDHYIGQKDGKPARDIVTVMHRTITIDGVSCSVVSDRLFLSGHLAERTLDYYAQSANGEVWYFGEDTAELDPNGKVTSTEGSWRAGKDGAKAGILMPADPRVGRSGLSEYYKGQAEDHWRVAARLGPNAILMEEWTPLEPGVLDHKTYVRGTGTVLERTVKGGDELDELVRVTRS